MGCCCHRNLALAETKTADLFMRLVSQTWCNNRELIFRSHRDLAAFAFLQNLWAEGNAKVYTAGLNSSVFSGRCTKGSPAWCCGRVEPPAAGCNRGAVTARRGRSRPEWWLQESCPAFLFKASRKSLAENCFFHSEISSQTKGLHALVTHRVYFVFSVTCILQLRMDASLPCWVNKHLSAWRQTKKLRWGGQMNVLCIQELQIHPSRAELGWNLRSFLNSESLCMFLLSAFVLLRLYLLLMGIGSAHKTWKLWLYSFSLKYHIYFYTALPNGDVTPQIGL